MHRIPRAKRSQAHGHRNASWQKRLAQTAPIPICGRRPVEELLCKGIKPEKLLVEERDRQGRPDELLERLQAAGWKVELHKKPELDSSCGGLHHQGYIALIREFPYWRFEDLIAEALERSSDPFIVALDEIQDVGNLGAILRTAECAGAAGAVLPLHRSAAVTATVVRSSAGAALHLPISRVINLSGGLDELKEAGFRILGADQEGNQSLYAADLKGPLTLVIGSEGRGLRPGIKRRCETLISIPLRGRVSSLNASVAAALCLYEALRQRMPL